MPEPVQRKLTTILAADAEGYSRLMERDERAALNALRTARGVFARFIERHYGRVANTAGDGLIAEFPSVVEAVQCAIEVQNELGSQHDGGGALRFRIGVHLGDVIVDGGDLLGEGVNLAARLQSMALPGDILLSQQVYDQVHSKLSVAFHYVGERRPKNYSQDVPVYRIVGPGAGTGGDALARLAAYAPGGADTAPASPGPDTAALRAKVVSRARTFGLVWVALVLINIGSGPPFWSFWPGLAFAVLLGLLSAPLFARRRIGLNGVRMAVILAALMLINAVTWSGYAWSLWPVGGALALRLVSRRAAAGR